MEAGRELDALIAEKPCRKCGCTRMKTYGTEGRRYCPDCRARRFQRNGHGPKFRHYEWVWRLPSRYGMSETEYMEMLTKQNGGCAMCGTRPKPPRHLTVDHNHTTGKIRGLLCDPCNRGIARFENDTTLIDKAIAYLGRKLA